MNLKKGVIKVADGLYIHPRYSFEDFKKTGYYTGQDGIRVIPLGKQYIDGRNFMVTLFFRDGEIYLVSLVCIDCIYSEENEMNRKALHDSILRTYGIEEEKKFPWGKVSSSYDDRGNCSSINLIYNMSGFPEK